MPMPSLPTSKRSSHPTEAGAASPGPARRRRSTTRPLVAALAVGASALTLWSLEGPSLAIAQRADQRTIETPMGRAPITFADIVERVKPAVVSISVTNGESKVARRERRGGRGMPGLPPGFPDLPEDHPLNEFFKNLPKDFQGPQSPRPSAAQGSGFVISADGYVVTNNHVVEGAGKIEVSFDDQEKLEAELVGTDARTDLALIKIKASKSFPFVKFADKAARVGDWVIAVGNPFGLGGTVTAGIVSALTRDIGSGPYDFLQIDAAVNRGNSGGPTFSIDGEVIGVNTAIFSPSGGNVGIAFAVPAKTASEVIAQLKKSGSVSRGWLGVKIQNVDEDTAASLGLPQARGALISDVTANGPAAGAGLKARDAILAVNGDRIEDSRDLARKIAGYAPDSTVDVKIWRNTGEQNVKVKLGTFPSSSEEIAKLEEGKPASSDSEIEQLGLTLAPAATGSTKEGIAISEVEQGSDAAQKGLKAGDVILEVQGEPVKSASDVMDGVRKAQGLGRKAVLLHVRSGDQKRFVAVQLKAKG